MRSKPGEAFGIRRRDATGHLDPDYARGLRSFSGASREGDARAFLERSRGADELSEGLGTAFLEGATSGEGAGTEHHERANDADVGGPFVPTSARHEFAYEADGPSGATPGLSLSRHVRAGGRAAAGDRGAIRPS